MSYEHVNYREVSPVAGAMHFLREPLECEHLGFTVIECDPGWTGKEHDHADRGHEEVYYLVDGSSTVTVEGEAVELEPGDALRVAPEATRQIENGQVSSTVIVVGAP